MLFIQILRMWRSILVQSKTSLDSSTIQYKTQPKNICFQDKDIIKHTLSSLIWHFGDLWNANISKRSAISPADMYLLYLQQVKVPCASLSREPDQQLCRWVWVYWLFSMHRWRFSITPSGVYVEMFYLCYISFTVGYHVSPHPLQFDLDLGAQM